MKNIKHQIPDFRAERRLPPSRRPVCCQASDVNQRLGALGACTGDIAMECNLAWSNLGRRAAPVAAAQMDTVVDEIKLVGLTELIILMAIVPVLHMWWRTACSGDLPNRWARPSAWLRHIIWSS